jgi:hypothetical protein
MESSLLGENTMKRPFLLILGTLILAPSLSAQQTPQVEVSTGYSIFSIGLNQQGGSISVAGNLNPWFGIVGDFGAYRGSSSGVSLNTYTFMAGPRFSMRNHGPLTPFAQVLVGGAHLGAKVEGFSGSLTPFAMSLGSGLDLRMTPHLSLRPQLDAIVLRAEGTSLVTPRASLGLVFRFGER